MSGPGVLLFVVFPLLLAFGGVAAVVAGRRRSRRLTFDEQTYPGLVALRRTTIGLRWLGIVAGLAAGLAVLPLGSSAPAAFAAPLVTAIVVVVALLVGQHLSYERARADGSAALENRRVRDYVPTVLARKVVGAVAVLLAVAGFTTLAASPDSLGRPGRSLSAAWTEVRWVADDAGVLREEVTSLSGAASPFPGSSYTLAVVAALAVLAAVVGVGLLATARRPRNGADPELVRVDDALRRITVEGILAAAGVGVAGTTFALAGGSYPRLGAYAQIPVYLACTYALALVALWALIRALAWAVVLVVPGNGDPR